MPLNTRPRRANPQRAGPQCSEAMASESPVRPRQPSPRRVRICPLVIIPTFPDGRRLAASHASALCPGFAVLGLAVDGPGR